MKTICIFCLMLGKRRRESREGRKREKRVGRRYPRRRGKKTTRAT
jgi:hypothetical protein